MRTFHLACVAALACASFAHAQRNLKDIPDPDPELERKSFVVADGFEVNLYASDPDIAKPIHMNFDARGRLWIASSTTYPHIKPGEQARDEVLVLEDTDRDGKADKTTVFADDLLIPTGVLPGDGGCYVANSTDLLFLKDTNGDGKADQRRTVLSGFGTEDTHHLLHTLRWGVDGAMYMNQSIYIHSHIETPHGVKRLNGGGIWRFRPDTMELEVFCRGFVNPWGHHQDRWGQSFATDGAYGEGINYVFPGAIFATAPGEKRRLRGLNPGSPKHCGLEILSGRHLPPEWAGSMITNDFRAHRVCRFVVSEDGSGYASRQAPELIKTKHVAFRPVDVKMGPDGAIYIADWYNPIIQHGEVDFRDPRRDHTHGRIWRVTAKERPLVEPPQIVDAPIEELLDLLKAEEDWIRLWAKRELKTRDKGDVTTSLDAWLAKLDNGDPRSVHQRLEALWTYQTINEVNAPLLRGLLAADDHRARAAAVRVASHWQDRIANATDIYRRAATDEHPRVRLEGVRALARVVSAKAAEFAAAALDKPVDRFLDFALWQTMRDLKPQWLPALEQGEIDFGGDLKHLTFALKAVDSPRIVGLLLERFEAGDVAPEQARASAELIGSLGKPEELRRFLAYVLSRNSTLKPDARAALLKTLLAGTTQRRIRLTGDMSELVALMKADDETLRIQAVRAAGAWRVPGTAAQIAELASDRSAALALRKAALDALALNGDASSQTVLTSVAANGQSADVRGYAVEQLASVDVEQAARLAANFLAQQAEPRHVAPVIAAIASQKSGPARLARSFEERKLHADIAKLALRAARAAPGNTAQLQAAIRTAGGLSAEPKKYTPEEIAALAAEVKAQGDPHRGEAIYRRKELQCLNCHAIGGAGGKVGPDLISIGASAQVDYLIESLVDPNAKVKENFHSIVVETEAGKIYSGIPVQRTEKQLVLRDQSDNEVTFPVGEIFEQREGRSLMPEGLVEPLTREELVDLTAFLSQLGKEGEFAVGKEPVVRTWRKLIYTRDGHRRLNRTSHDTAATDDPALSWAPAYSKVSGELPIDEKLHPFVIHRGHPPASFVRFEVNVTTAGDVAFDFGDVQGLTLWVDGKPARIAPKMVLPLSKGRHVFTIGIDRQQRARPLRVALTDVAGSDAQAALVGGK